MRKNGTKKKYKNVRGVTIEESSLGIDVLVVSWRYCGACGRSIRGTPNIFFCSKKLKQKKQFKIINMEFNPQTGGNLDHYPNILSSVPI